jgi:hypothetical protein
MLFAERSVDDHLRDGKVLIKGMLASKTAQAENALRAGLTIPLSL